MIPVLETKRLILRAPDVKDLDAETAFWASERADFVGGQKQPHEVWRVLATFLGHWAIRGYGFWAVDEKATGIYCGRVGIWHPGDWPEAEIGWTMMAGSEGKGIATEAALAVRTYAYDTLGWTTTISTIDPENTRSKALATKLGAKFERMHDFQGGYSLEIWRHPGPGASC